jgi:hypothetical protein
MDELLLIIYGHYMTVEYQFLLSDCNRVPPSDRLVEEASIA